MAGRSKRSTSRLSLSQHLQNDPILVPFMNAHDEAEANIAAGVIFAEHTMTDVDRIIRSRIWGFTLDAQDAEDLRNEVVLRLLTRLKRCRDHGDVIYSWPTYVRQTAENTYRVYLRHKRPEWRWLKNRIRYVLKHQREFALWQPADGDWLCGLAPWIPEQPISVDRAEEIAGLLATNRTARARHRRGQRSADLVQLMRDAFSQANGPMSIDAVVGIVLHSQGLHRRDVPIDAPGVEPHLVSEGIPVDVEIGQRETLERMWREICALPLQQRQALLLNLRGERDWPGIEVFPLSGVASIREIAHVLEEPALELARLWPQLPLADAAIAAKLGKTRQQVVNLRKAARDRLKRRMGR